MSNSTSVRVILTGGYPEIGGGPQITVHVNGDEFVMNERGDLGILDDGAEIAIFATGEWRYAQLMPSQGTGEL